MPARSWASSKRSCRFSDFARSSPRAFRDAAAPSCEALTGCPRLGATCCRCDSRQSSAARGRSPRSRAASERARPGWYGRSRGPPTREAVGPTTYPPIEDGEPFDAPILRRGVDFILAQRAAGKTVFVACGAGISRSPTARPGPRASRLSRSGARAGRARGRGDRGAAGPSTACAG